MSGRPTSKPSRALLDQIESIAAERGGVTALLERAQVTPSTLRKIREQTPVTSETVQKLERAVKYLNKPYSLDDTPKPTPDVSKQPIEPSEIVERYDEVTKAATAFLKYFSNGADRLLGTGKARRAYEQLQEALTKVA